MFGPSIRPLRAACLALLLAACAQAPVPVQAPPAPRPRVSYINVPVTIPLDTLGKAIDEVLARSLDVEPFGVPLAGGAAPPACGADAGYGIERGPVALSGSGRVLSMDADLAYWVKGRKQLPCPGEAVVASCGTDGEPPRTVRVGTDSELAILPDLSLQVRSTLRPATPGDRCVLKPVGLDVTDALVAAAGTMLQEKLPGMDQRLSAAMNLRARMQAAWARMGEPREVRPGVWLAWNPEGIGVVQPTVSDGALHAGVQLRLRPVIGVGAKPEVRARPLPLAYDATRDDGFRLQVPVDVEQSYMQDRLDKALGAEQGGKTLTIGNYHVTVTEADVTGEGAQILVRLHFTGDFSGTAELSGTPVYDPQTRSLAFPDLDYNLDSDQFLLNTANFVAQSQIRDRLRQRFVIELGSRIDRLKQNLGALLNRRDGNVELSGSVDELSLLGVARRSNDKIFTVYLSARGRVSLQVASP